MPFDPTTDQAYTADEIQQTTEDVAAQYYKDGKEGNGETPSRDGLFKYLTSYQDVRVQTWLNVNATRDRKYVDSLYREVKEKYYGNTRPSAQGDLSSRPDPT